MAKMTKETRIKRRIKELWEIYEPLPENKKKIAGPLIENAAFMEISLQELQESLNKNGYTETYQNGATQTGKKGSSDLSAYNNLMKSYVAVSGKLEAMLKDIPVDSDKKSKLEQFMEANS